MQVHGLLPLEPGLVFKLLCFGLRAALNKNAWGARAMTPFARCMEMSSQDELKKLVSR